MVRLSRVCVAATAVVAAFLVAASLPLLAASKVSMTRPVILQGQAAGHAYCAVLDAGVFAETGPGLRGLGLIQNDEEIPFVTTVSEPQSEQTDAARVLRLREQDGALVFDLEMPARAYTELNFRLRLKDFVAVAEISAGTRVGEFKLFDLSGQHLARQMMVQLPEMHELVLHVTLRAPGKKLQMDDLEGVDVGPDRAAQSLYTQVATTAAFADTARETIAEVDVPAHVPVQRIRFETTAANFLRRVRVEAWPVNDPHDVETISGEISSTHRADIADTQLVVPMTLGANLQGPAHVRVILENDGEPPVALRGVTLEMREHKMCFDASASSHLQLIEGSDAAPLNTLPALTETSWQSAGVAVLGAASVRTVPQASMYVPPVHYRWRRRHTLLVILALLTMMAAYPLILSRKKARG
jgi:hypothetical protein